MKTLRACVVGYPLRKTLSPLIHGEWIARHGLEGAYEAVPAAPGRLGPEIERLRAGGYDGCNVTIPFKEEAISLCDSLDGGARAIGAVNTLVFRDGKIEGKNTDAYGFAQNLQQKCPRFRAADGPALVLGAGGAARAVIFALREAGAPEVMIANRSPEKAVALAAGPGGRAVPWEDRIDAARDARLLVNTTSLGMTGQPPLDMPLDGLPAAATVCDIVYTPLMTPLLLEAERRGHPFATGLGMLLHQAAAAFHAWTGIMPDVDDAIERLALEHAA